jgi:hypothetical protein
MSRKRREETFGDEILELFGRPVAVHRVFCAMTQSLHAGAMLSQAVYWTTVSQHPGKWFFKTQEEWWQEIYLTRYEQEAARKKLRALGFWREERRGIPAKIWFQLDIPLFMKYLMNYLKTTTNPSLQQNSKQGCSEKASKAAAKCRPITETTDRDYKQREKEGHKGVFVGQNKRKHAHATPLETYGDAVSWHDGTQWLGHFPRSLDPEPDPDLADAVHDILQAYYTSYVNRDTWVRGPLEHPLLKEAQLLRIERILRDALAILFAAGPCDPIALVDQFWGPKERGRKDGNVNVFATGGMLAQLAYECRYVQERDTTWNALKTLTD